MSQCVAFITAQGQNKLLPGDLLVAQKLRDKYGVRILVVPWGSELPKSCRTVVLRSCYDYAKHIHKFKVWLQNLEEHKVAVLNHLSLVYGNLDKQYLLNLQKVGVSIVPTVRFEPDAQVSLSNIMADMGWSRVVIKPSVSAGAADTHLLEASSSDSEFQIFEELLAKQPMLVQPFIPEIISFGEISLVFFDGRFSHAVSKKPPADEFRVQERFGGVYQPTQPSSIILEAASSSLNVLPSIPTFARVDGVVVDGVFLLMELELIEPRLYLSTCPDAADRFTAAIASGICAANESA